MTSLKIFRNITQLSDKSEIILNIIENDFQCPSSIVLKKSKSSFLYLDEEAASFLKK